MVHWTEHWITHLLFIRKPDIWISIIIFMLYVNWEFQSNLYNLIIWVFWIELIYSFRFMPNYNINYFWVHFVRSLAFILFIFCSLDSIGLLLNQIIF